MEAQRLANLGSWVRDLEVDKLAWSEQLYEIFGIQPEEEFAGTFEGYLARIHPDDREHVREEVARAIATGRRLPGRPAHRPAERGDPVSANLGRIWSRTTTVA